MFFYYFRVEILQKKVKIMVYKEFETVLSKARLNKYRTACLGDEQKTLELYLLNVELAKDFHGLLGLFEIALRNAIDEHYSKHFNDINWLVNQAKKDFFSKKRNTVIVEFYKLTAIKAYTPSNLIAALSFGVWTEMFTSHCFAKGSQTLLKIFPNRPKGVNQKCINLELREIKFLRNKIAHHEHICFNKYENISADYLETMRKKILKYFVYLGVSENVVNAFDVSKDNLNQLRNFNHTDTVTVDIHS